MHAQSPLASLGGIGHELRFFQRGNRFVRRGGRADAQLRGCCAVVAPVALLLRLLRGCCACCAAKPMPSLPFASRACSSGRGPEGTQVAGLSRPPDRHGGTVIMMTRIMVAAAAGDAAAATEQRRHTY